MPQILIVNRTHWCRYAKRETWPPDAEKGPGSAADVFWHHKLPFYRRTSLSAFTNSSPNTVHRPWYGPAGESLALMATAMNLRGGLALVRPSTQPPSPTDVGKALALSRPWRSPQFSSFGVPPDAAMSDCRDSPLERDQRPYACSDRETKSG